MVQQSPTKQEVVAEFRRHSILQAARKVFARQGYRATTVDEIAEEGCFAKGTLYCYFKSKEEIYLTALTQDLQALLEETSRRVAQASTTYDKLSEFVTIRLEHSERHADFVRIFFSEFSNLAMSPARVNKSFQKLMQQSNELLRGVLEAGIASGEVRALPVDRLAFAINDLTRSVIERRLMGFVKGQAPDDLAFVMDLIWRGIARS
jgi:AcrR family transcriptional regulator